MRGHVEAKDSKYHSRGGPLTVERAGHQLEIGQTFLAACRHLGLKISDDFSGEEQLGFGYRHQMTRDGARASSSNTFLREAIHRPNLSVMLYSMVDKILIDGGRAKGVLIRRGTELRRVFAKREVIVSAGAIETPKLLMLSGIGPAEHLLEMGIEVIRYVPFTTRTS